MLDKKMVVVVVALTLLGATMALGANIIVNGSGIVAGTQPAIESELIIGQSGTPANILVITQGNRYLFRGTVDAVTSVTDNTDVKLLVTNITTNKQYNADANKTGINTWTLEITNPDGSDLYNYILNGNLQITSR